MPSGRRGKESGDRREHIAGHDIDIEPGARRAHLAQNQGGFRQSAVVDRAVGALKAAALEALREVENVETGGEKRRDHELRLQPGEKGGRHALKIDGFDSGAVALRERRSGAGAVDNEENARIGRLHGLFARNVAIIRHVRVSRFDERGGRTPAMDALTSPVSLPELQKLL